MTVGGLLLCPLALVFVLVGLYVLLAYWEKPRMHFVGILCLATSVAIIAADIKLYPETITTVFFIVIGSVVVGLIGRSIFR